MTTTSARVHVEVKRPAVILALFLLLAGARAWSQNGLPSPDLPQNLRSTGFRPAQEQQRELHSAQSSLPDAPSAVLATQRERFHALVETKSPLIFGGAAINASMASESPEHLATGVTPSFGALYGAPVVQKESNVFFDKYFYPAPRRQDLRYQPSTSDSFLGRASYAASRLLITRDDSGKRKFNASYLLRVLTSAAVATAAYRPTSAAVATTIYGPYRTQPVSDIFGNFGSTIGGDAGRNIFHEFWPRIHQILEGHSLKVLQRVEERIGEVPMPAALVSTPAR